MTEKVCSQCRLSLSLDLFHKNIRRKDGYHEYCKDCRKEQYNRRDKTSAIKRSARRYKEKRKECLDGMREYYLKRLEEKKLYGRKHYEQNKYKYVSNAMERKAQIKRATPKWFDSDHRFVYREAHLLAKLREQTTNIKWEVDHIVPLRGKNVCGLHLMENFAVIPKVLNNYKRAKFSEDFGDRTLFYARKGAGK